MDLNKVRLLETCFAYLVDKTSPLVKSELEKSSLVFECNQKLCQFKTYQDRPTKVTFIEYQLGYMELREQRKEIYNVYDLYKALNLQGNELSALAQLADVTIVKAIIMKLLVNADLNALSEIYPDIKDNNLAYEYSDLDNGLTFPIYHLPNKVSFRLVAIT